MYTITIDFDKHAGHYKVELRKQKSLFGFKYWKVVKGYRGPYTWIKRLALKWHLDYLTNDIIDKTLQS